MDDAPTGTALTCPKCAGVMRSYERNGVVVEQCGSCRGVFLDRGELEHLLDFERRMNDAPAAVPSGGGAAPRDDRGYRDDRGHRDDDHRRHDRDDRHRHHDDDYYKRHKRHKRKGILSEIFDFD